ncbi:oligopeptidase B [Sulfobacillus thermosulfidooxidans DSM 9293]|uniref:Oligopeptidase B n=1 Tax=Sulfobacillus thermosulfidooxidans (strain DSM 9293 / VKM B-1269 / AT-1) TaxID=929705 RepID=A0A1W1WKV8_SULTA|nr:S9 family peptidase [Sulfobacillus thermosulfidooxidans]SMC06948.1 oligopeptidase B [Sulfobacillus thermosulfidooxidans DSM 9293]
MVNPPKAPKKPYWHQLHGDIRPDDYYWLRERNNPEVIRYLEEENQYFESAMKPLEPLTEKLAKEIRSHIAEDDTEIPVQDGPYFYYKRMVANLEYPIYARKRANTRQELTQVPEEIILDLNTLAKPGEFLSVTVQKVSPNHQLLAFLENHDGTDRYTLRILDLRDHHFLPDSTPNIFLQHSVEWDASGQFLYYLKVDESQRPFQLWRHRLGDVMSNDVLIYEETDLTYTLSLTKSLDGQYLLLTSQNKRTNEIRVLPTQEPEGSWTVFWPRETDVLYFVEHWHHQFIVLTNKEARNFTLLSCPDSQLSSPNCTALVPYNDNQYLQHVYPFAQCVIVSGREEGLTQLWIYHEGQLTRLQWPESLYYVSMGPNRDANATEILVHYESFLTPTITYGLDPQTRQLTILKQQEVPGGYEPQNYEQKRLWVTAADGVDIPVSMVYRRGLLQEGPHPLILYGYGSYGMSTEPHFDPSKLPLLDRGVILATAHVRGGSERGRWWYEQGKLMNKRNTFTDFITVARYLIDHGFTVPQKLAARGRSAGGLLMGAVLNMAPELFQVVVPGVPFVDVVTTMLDATIPLTTLEWDEWGDPHFPEAYAYMKSYSPYDNIESKDYPHIFIYTGLNDPRVGYFEPAKFVARLREMKTDTHQLLLKTHMGAGHSGASGRYSRIRETAEEYAFILDKLGIGQ